MEPERPRGPSTAPNHDGNLSHEQPGPASVDDQALADCDMSQIVAQSVELGTSEEEQAVEHMDESPNNEGSELSRRASSKPDLSTPTSRAGLGLTIDTGMATGQHEGGERRLNESPVLSPTTPLVYEDDSRPVSAGNLPSPYATNQWSAFMAVPGARSRQDSISSIDSWNSRTQSIASVLSDYHNKALDDDLEVLDTADALEPDPGTEHDFCVENNPFAFTPGQLNKMFNPKSLCAFHALGGLAGLERGLRTDCTTGLSIDEHHLEGSVSFEEATVPENKSSACVPRDFWRQQMAATHIARAASFIDRKRVFGDNRIPHKKEQSIFKLAWMEYCDAILVLLTVCAITTIGVGVYQAVGQKVQRETFSWPEGVAICAAVLIVVALEAANDWRKQHHFLKLQEQKKDTCRPVRVLRSGKKSLIPATDVCVGDILLFEPGDTFPVDGIYVEGHDVSCDEAEATGESDSLIKTRADLVFQAIKSGGSLRDLDPIIYSGSTVVTGQGSCLVTATGPMSSLGKLTMCLREDADGVAETPLQKKLNLLSEQVAKVGFVAAVLLFVVLFIKFVVRLVDHANTANATSKGLQFLYIAIIAITIVDVAIPSGLPLAQTVALALATSRMLKDNILVRDLRACETLGYTSTICADDTALLSDKPQTVVTGVLGANTRFGSMISVADNSENIDGAVDKEDGPEKNAPQKRATPPIPETQTSAQVISGLNPLAIEMMRCIIVATTTAAEIEGSDGQMRYLGDPTECALLEFAQKSLGVPTIAEERRRTATLKIVDLNWQHRSVCIITKLPSGKYRMLVRTSAAMLLHHSSTIVADPRLGLEITTLSKDMRISLERTIYDFESAALSTVGLAFKDIDTWPMRKHFETAGTELSKDITMKLDSAFTFLGVLGLSLPLQNDLRSSVTACYSAGVCVRIVSTQSQETAKAIATQIGLGPNLSMDGPVFRRLSRRDMKLVVPKLDVLARASDEDKRVFIKQLLEHDGKVAALSAGRDVASRPLLRTASVNIVVQSGSTDFAKQKAGIVILDDLFSSVLQAILWVRAVSDSVQKFLQFQLTINIPAVVLAFISSVSHPTEQSVLNSVQLLWVNLIMDLFAILALAYDSPTKNQLHRPPTKGRSPLVTLRMWKMILGQAFFQLAICFTLYHTDLGILGFRKTLLLQDRDSLVFNVFVWMQIFNQLNCRRVDNRFNILEGITNNLVFFLITGLIVGVQCLLIFFGGKALNTTALSPTQWGCSIATGACTIPIGALIRCVPDHWIRWCIPKRLRLRKSKKPEMISDFDHWDNGMLAIKDDLSFTGRIRFGKLRGLQSSLRNLRYTREALASWGAADSDAVLDVDDDVEAARGSASPMSGRGRTSGMGSVSGMSESSITSRLRRRPMSRPNSIGSAISVPGVVAGAIAIASPGSDSISGEGTEGHEKSA